MVVISNYEGELPEFSCRICSRSMAGEETALRVKEKEEDSDCSIAYCEECVAKDPALKDKQIFLMRMLISQALLTCDKETQEEIKREISQAQPEDYKNIQDLFGLSRTIEVADESGNIIEKIIT